MVWKFAKTCAASLSVLCLISTLALAQVGGTGGSAGTGAAGSMAGSSNMGPGSGNLGTGPASPSVPNTASPSVTGSPGMPNTASPSISGPAQPGTLNPPATSSDRELRMQGEAPRTEPGTDLQRRSGLDTAGGTATNTPDTAGTSRTLLR